MSNIVTMTSCHVPQVAALEKECFSDPWSQRSVASELENPLALWLVWEEDGKVLELHVAEGDMGKVIGRQGRIAKEIRTIIKTVAQRTGEKVTVEIVD